ncbi:hypothetical protein [Saccharopolyspora shandongensis]|uniref:hypothetical protein n=1 Tax=Saccharopolyspora shandongensis TaxID=418495 RepID=UPI00115F9D69|nr:hypothetical protein [Saccharopolyspora shandongensis]
MIREQSNKRPNTRARRPSGDAITAEDEKTRQVRQFRAAALLRTAQLFTDMNELVHYGPIEPRGTHPASSAGAAHCKASRFSQDRLHALNSVPE